jgi:hypothetical protein
MQALVPYAQGALLILVIGIRVWFDRLDRERIREHVESRGGKILNISWNPFGNGWPDRSARFYEVRYRTHRGRIVTAKCTISRSSGINWLREAPPGLPHAIEALAEPIACLGCGKQIPAQKTDCQHCGWSYASQQSL